MILIKRCLLLVLTALLVSCDGHFEVRRQLNEGRTERFEAYVNDAGDTVRDGSYEMRRDSVLLISTTYRNGKQTGIRQEFAPNGQVLRTAMYTNDRLDGEVVLHYENGRRKAVRNYRNDTLHGQALTYYENSSKPTVQSAYIYRDGLKQDSARHFYADGSLKYVEHYKDDRLHGKRRTFAPDGTLVLIETYEDGECNGNYIEYYESNGNVREKTTYRNGKLNGKLTRYDEAGNLVVEATYENGRLEGRRIEYINGRKARVAMYKNGRRDGSLTDYYTNGSVHYTLNYSNDKPAAFWTVYGKDGEMLGKNVSLLIGKWRYVPEKEEADAGEAADTYRSDGTFVSVSSGGSKDVGKWRLNDNQTRLKLKYNEGGAFTYNVNRLSLDTLQISGTNPNNRRQYLYKRIR